VPRREGLIVLLAPRLVKKEQRQMEQRQKEQRQKEQQPSFGRADSGSCRTLICALLSMRTNEAPQICASGTHRRTASSPENRSVAALPSGSGKTASRCCLLWAPQTLDRHGQ